MEIFEPVVHQVARHTTPLSTVRACALTCRRAYYVLRRRLYVRHLAAVHDRRRPLVEQPTWCIYGAARRVVEYAQYEDRLRCRSFGCAVHITDMDNGPVVRVYHNFARPAHHMRVPVRTWFTLLRTVAGMVRRVVRAVVRH